MSAKFTLETRNTTAQKAQRCYRNMIYKSDDMSHTFGEPEIPYQIHFYESKLAGRVQPDLHLVHPRKFLPGPYQKSAMLPTPVETVRCVNHRDYRPPCNQAPHSL